MTLDLHPADLGRVRLEIRVEGALVHVAMSAERQTTSDLLRQTMPEFRRSLGAAGLTPGNIALGADASSGRDSSNGPRNPHSGQDANLAWNQNRAGQERRSTPDNPRSADADIRTPDDFRSVRRTSTDSSPMRLSVDLLL